MAAQPFPFSGPARSAESVVESAGFDHTGDAKEASSSQDKVDQP
jgi:hypothetical protein